MSHRGWNVSFLGRVQVLLVATLFVVGLVGCSGSGSEKDENAPDASDIILLELDWSAEGAPSVSNVIRATDRDGYDNQPRFLPDGSAFLYTSIDRRKVNVFRYDVAQQSSTQLTDTVEREYSATPIPGSDDFSAVQVEKDGMQRIWRFGPDGTVGKVVMKWGYIVQYYDWINEEVIAMVIDDEESPTPNLTFAHIPSQRVSLEPVEFNVGRCLRAVPNREALGYVLKGKILEGTSTIQDYELPDPTAWWLREVNFEDGSSKTRIQMPEGVEDFAWTADAGVFTSRGSELLYWNGEGEDLPLDAWSSVGGLDSANLGAISRMTMDPTGRYLAVVVTR